MTNQLDAPQEIKETRERKQTMLTYRTEGREVEKSLGVEAGRIKSGNDRKVTNQLDRPVGDKGNT
ncbi:hypothetical protein [Virgibacillus senegalensis]|uniref:hypothetical protein n=1 Tax=Virgibacillus senegalensis TaxID=1499679 RepID=UPI00069E7D13|nr:hypothetical protein [Virgibacillus senegalensis]